MLIGLWFCGFSFAGTVTMDGQTWRSLQSSTEVAPIEATEISAVRRDLTVWADGDSTRIRAIWTLRVSDETVVTQRWIREPLREASVRVDGQRVMLRANDGLWASFSLSAGTHTVVLEGLLSPPLGLVKQTITLADAAISEVEVRTVDEPIVESQTSVRLAQRFWTSGPVLQVATRPVEPKKARRTVVLGSVGTGVTVGESSAAGQARVRLKVQSGSVSTVELDVRGLGSDLQVSGSGVVGWKLNGNRLVIDLGREESYLAEFDLRWSHVLNSDGDQTVPLPQIKPLQVLRTVSTLQLARDGEVEVLPSVEGGSPMSSSRLEEWGSGLVTGTSTASYAFSGPVRGSLQVVRFSPVPGPPTLVDVATITVAASDEGRGLMRAHYAVRNDRAAHLRIAPPPGSTLVSARVAGRSVALGRDGEVLLVPLEKSVETVQGLLAFPVEVGFLFDREAWARRERRSIDLPRVNAPVAVMRSTLVLPPGYADRGDELAGRVGDFADGPGLQYGLGSGGSARSEVLMQNAVDAWMANDFGEAQGYLDTLRDEGLDDENAERLQSNLDVITGDSKGDFDVTLERRVRQQAQARSEDDRTRQDQAMRKAKKAKSAGDYEAASRAYEEAYEIGQQLDLLEQEESVENAFLNEALLMDLEMARQEATEAQEMDRMLGADPATGGVLEILESESPSAGVLLLDRQSSGVVFESAELDSSLSGGLGGLIGSKGVQVGSGGLGSRDSTQGQAVRVEGYLSEGTSGSSDGAVGTAVGLGARGSGLGGGGSAEGLGGLGTKGRGSGSSGYGSGGGTFGAGKTSAESVLVESQGSEPKVLGNEEPAKPSMEHPAAAAAAPSPMDSGPTIEVTSVQNTTVVPVIGAPIRYEHRLLPPDESLQLDVFAVITRRSP